jgi:menaquinone-dependent protoporphyrinogen oxidase
MPGKRHRRRTVLDSLTSGAAILHGKEPSMSDPWLVTWATRSGSTAEVAKQIAAVLREKGAPIEALPMRDVHHVTDYRAVVLGTPLYFGRLHRDARRFLAAHHEELRALPVALFVLGPIHADDGEYVMAGRQLRRQLEKYRWFDPVVKEIFGGRWDPAKLGPLRWIPALRRMQASDARDWEAIRTWAESLQERLASPVSA